MNSYRTRFGILILTLMGLVVLGYGYARAHDLIAGTKIVILEPRPMETTTKQILTIRGEVGPITHLKINGDQVLVGEDGHFELKLLLATGFNLLEVRATDKFNREVKKIFEVVYQPEIKTDIK